MKGFLDGRFKKRVRCSHCGKPFADNDGCWCIRNGGAYDFYHDPCWATVTSSS